MLGTNPGIFYTTHVLPASASGENTAYKVVAPNPFQSEYAYVESAELVPIETITGDDTNTTNFNLDLVAGTEIANKDFPTGEAGAKGVAEAFTFTGTDAQRRIAPGGAVLVETEEAGTQPARAYGSVIRIGWRGAGVVA
jgi:hypothetical protein